MKLVPEVYHTLVARWPGGFSENCAGEVISSAACLGAQKAGASQDHPSLRDSGGQSDCSPCELAHSPRCASGALARLSLLALVV